MRCWPGAMIAGVLLVQCGAAGAAAVQHSVLDRVAAAVDGAESDHGENLAMWRPDPTGPQGPMQVSAAAATDVGGGDRFDTAANRAIGRAYLAELYRRYHNWPDAIAAYNWGIGRLNAWLDAGRPAGKLAKGVAAYTDRVLRDSGLCTAANAPPAPGRFARPRFAARSGRKRLDEARSAHDIIGNAACAHFAGGSAKTDGSRWRNDNRLLVGLVSDAFYRELEDAVNQTARDLRSVERR
jgi:transglycosylase-like protein with SLT domain